MERICRSVVCAAGAGSGKLDVGSDTAGNGTKTSYLELPGKLSDYIIFPRSRNCHTGCGFLSDRYSRKAIILPSLALYGIAGIWRWNRSRNPFVLDSDRPRALQGIGAAGTSPIAMAFVGDMYKGGAKAKRSGLIEASNGAGKVVSPILGSLFA